MAKKQMQIGEFIIEKEGDFLKFTHQSKDFNFRILANDRGDKFFQDAADETVREYFNVMLPSLKLFYLLVFSSSEYSAAWMKFHNDYFADKAENVTEEQNAEILAEVEQDYNEQQAIINELNNETV